MSTNDVMLIFGFFNSPPSLPWNLNGSGKGWLSINDVIFYPPRNGVCTVLSNWHSLLCSAYPLTLKYDVICGQTPPYQPVSYKIILKLNDFFFKLPFLVFCYNMKNFHYLQDMPWNISKVVSVPCSNKGWEPLL